jgi:DNA-binding beta-propeller fold protein YncE
MTKATESIDTISPATSPASAGKIVVANRSSGNISILDAVTGQLIKTVDLPAGDNGRKAEPMYVQKILSTKEFVVADRAHNRVVFFDQETYQVTGTIATGAGNFHLQIDQREKQLWVVNDLDKTLTIINPQTKTNLGKVTLPPELIGLDSKPHDVVIDPSGKFVYVSVLREKNTTTDLLLKIDAKSRKVLSSIEVGKDPHLALAPESNLLYVASQGGNKVDVFDRTSPELTKVTTINQPGAHGIDINSNGRYTYTTNISGGGAKGLFVIDNRTNQIVGNVNGVDTPLVAPHNIALSDNGQKLFIAHSGPTANQVSIYSLADPTKPVLESSIDDQGLNPFGIAYIAPNTDNLVNAKQGKATGGDGNDRIFGTKRNDCLKGGAGDDKIFGEKGDDIIYGNAGNDVLIGGEGDDLLKGGDGDDFLIGVNVESSTAGEDERDILWGGAGKDTFVLGDATKIYYGASGREDVAVIADFNVIAGDVIRLHGSSSDYQIKSRANGIAIFHQETFGDSELIGIIKGGRDLNLQSSAFEFV